MHKYEDFLGIGVFNVDLFKLNNTDVPDTEHLHFAALDFKLVKSIDTS